MPSLILLKSPEGVALSENIPLNGDVFVIGRDANECQIVIPHHAVSRKHARIVRDGGQFFIEDLQTRSGTYVNSKQIPRLGRQSLKHDDRIKICDFHFRFQDERVVHAPQFPDWISKDGKDEEKEIESAREAQRGYIPQSPPDVPGYEFGSYYSPAQTVGGDYYDFIALPAERVAVAIGDVAGKGVSAARLVAQLSSEVRFCLLTVPDLAQAVCLLNDQMSNAMGDRFVTLAVMVLDPVKHTLTIVNAGHQSPKLYRAATGELVDAIPLDAIGVPLGVIPDSAFEQVTLSLEVGDTVVMFTDGVTAELSPAGESFGNEALDRVLAPGGGAKQIGERLVETILQHCNGRAQNDDIAIVCFGRAERTT